MVELYEETVIKKIPGTIIDLETIGEFNRKYKDHRRLANLLPVIYGTLSENNLCIHYISNVNEVPDLLEVIKGTIEELPRPLWAFNYDFEQSIIYNQLGLKLEFKELQAIPYESKRNAVKVLRIEQFGDPFNDDGLLCSQKWKEGEINDAVSHNRACLLKEAEILLRRTLKGA